MSAFGRQSRIGFIGAGTVAKSFAIALVREGYPVAATASRSFSSAEDLAGRVEGCVAYESLQEAAAASDVVFVTTPDDAIRSTVESVTWRSGQAAVHTSGVLTLDVLETATAAGAKPGAFHPMQLFSSPEMGVQSIPGTTFGIDGDEEMTGYLREMALAIGGRPIVVKPEDKPLYHLSGVMMGGLLSSLGATAAQLWESFGFDRAQGVQALAPMMRGVANNLDALGVPGGVAGPYTRGDVGTVRMHLETLSARAPDVLPVYCEMAMAAIPLALEKGTVTAERADEMRTVVEQYRGQRKS
jgi:predicted short-subunit dehydrogenase-like oxidoreductase (DUF2520 family)